MIQSATSTEERIKEAAKKVFLEKGYEGTTTRDIAKEADLNMALLNYYFRSKEKLFMQVYEELAGMYFKELLELMNSPMTIKEKIVAIIENHFEMLIRNMQLGAFLATEFKREPERLCKVLNIEKAFKDNLLEQQLKEAIGRGEARSIDLKHLLAFIIANVQHPFDTQQLNMQVWNMTQPEYLAFAQRHKELSKEMIISFLLGKP
jgi:TetR/AcrR family transcriptional regulator